MTGETWYQREIPWIGKYLKSDKLLNRFTPSELKQLEKQYNTVVLINSANTFPIEAFEKYDKRVKDFNVFANIKWPAEGDGAISLLNKLKEDNDDAQKVQEDIASILAPGRTNITETFENAVKDINTKLATQDSTRLIRTITDTVKDARKDLCFQQQAEIQKLEDRFKDPAFANALKNVLNIQPEDDFNAIKDNMMNELKELHTKQLDSYDTTTCDYLAKIHNDAVKQKNRLLFIAALHKNDYQMREIINELIRQANGLTTQVSENDPNDKKIEISKVNLDKLATEMGIKNDGNKYTIDLGGYLSFSTLDYLSPYQQIQAKVDILAKTMKASGIEDVTITVQFSDKEIALERARQTYQAFVKAGYNPEQFVININGEVYKNKPDPKADPKDKKAKSFDELFNGHHQEYQLINSQAKESKDELQQLGLVNKSSAEFKKKMADSRNSETPPQPAAAQGPSIRGS